MILAALFAALIIVSFVIILSKLLRSRKIGQHRMVEERVHLSIKDVQANLGIKKKNNISDIAGFSRVLTKFNFSLHVSDLLKMSKLHLSVSVFYLFCLVLAGVTFMLTSRFGNPVNSIAISVLIAFTPYFYLVFNKKIYLKKFEEYFPNALNLISSSLKVGHVLEAGIDAVAASAPYPISDEFRSVQGEIKLGLTLQQALHNLHRRIGGQELKIFITGVAINNELGGNLSEILDNIEKTIRERFALKREIAALSAQGKMSAVVLFCLPLLIGAYMYQINQASFIEFFASKPGKTCIYLMILTQIVSFLGIRQAIKLSD